MDVNGWQTARLKNAPEGVSGTEIMADLHADRRCHPLTWGSAPDGAILN